jgi:predicted ArsR family transcriptional regulator
VADSRALVHFARALQELAFALAALVEELGERTHARAAMQAALRAEERRWRARAADDAAAARVAEVFSALADVLEPPARERRATRDTQRKFDPPRVRWDTRARWRS